MPSCTGPVLDAKGADIYETNMTGGGGAVSHGWFTDYTFYYFAKSGMPDDVTVAASAIGDLKIYNWWSLSYLNARVPLRTAKVTCAGSNCHTKIVTSGKPSDVRSPLYCEVAFVKVDGGEDADLTLTIKIGYSSKGGKITLHGDFEGKLPGGKVTVGGEVEIEGDDPAAHQLWRADYAWHCPSFVKPEPSTTTTKPEGQNTEKHPAVEQHETKHD